MCFLKITLQKSRFSHPCPFFPYCLSLNAIHLYWKDRNKRDKKIFFWYSPTTICSSVSWSNISIKFFLLTLTIFFAQVAFLLSCNSVYRLMPFFYSFFHWSFSLMVCMQLLHIISWENCIITLLFHLFLIEKPHSQNFIFGNFLTP